MLTGRQEFSKVKTAFYRGTFQKGFWLRNGSHRSTHSSMMTSDFLAWLVKFNHDRTWFNEILHAQQQHNARHVYSRAKAVKYILSVGTQSQCY